MSSRFKNLSQNWRFYFIFFIFFLLTLVIIFRFFNLQILNGKTFSTQAASQAQAKQADWQYLRGKIYFQDKDKKLAPAAVNKDFYQVYAVPAKISDPISVAKAVAGVFLLNEDDLIARFSRKTSQYDLIQKKVDASIVKQIESMKLQGIYVTQVAGRFYPFGSMAAQVLGYVKDDAQNFTGQYGLEKYFNNKLAPNSSATNLLDLLSLKNIIFDKDNYDLITTIDYNIQKKAEDILEASIKEWEAESGTIIVMEPKTGRILTMASYPNFDPNNYSKYPIKTFINPAVELVYEPGSVFKVITISSGIEDKKITPQTNYYDAGEVKIDGETIRNWDLKAYGWQTMAGVLSHSLNLGAIFVESKLGNDLFYQGVLNFDINQKTGITLPGEVKGNVDNLKGFQDIYFATASFGQGITVTPLGMITAVSAIANKGLMMKPYIIEKIIDSQTNEEQITEPQEVKRVISEETARLMRIMLVNAVEENKVATVKGYQVAGKTGTTQVLDANGKYGDETIHSFVGFAPAENPRFVILVKIDKPQKAKFAGATAIPAFRELAQYILNYYEIQPTE